jgi:hypothetical protein
MTPVWLAPQEWDVVDSRDVVSLRRPGPGALPLSGYGTFFSR